MTMAAIEFERTHDDFRGSNDKRLSGQDSARQIVDTLDVGLYGSISPEGRVGSSRNHYRTNESIWIDLRLGHVRHGDTITLDGFQILEWLPACPGRYFTPKAQLEREKAEQFWDSTNREYL